MTLKRLRWLLTPVASAAVLAVLVLPPRPIPEDFTLFGALLGLGGRSWVPDLRIQHRWAIERLRDGLRSTIAARAHGAADVQASHSPRALRSVVGPLVVVRDATVPDTAARAWLRVAEEELGRVPPAGATGVPVILGLHVRNPQDGDHTPWTETRLDRFQYVGGGARACIVDVVFPPADTRRHGRFDFPWRLRSNVLDRCALYARYGFPGLQVGRWAGVPPSWSGRRWWYWYWQQGGLFGLRAVAPDTLHFRPEGSYGGVPVTALGCLRGVDRYCAAIMGLSGGGHVGPTGIYYAARSWEYRTADDAFLGTLLTERSPTQFVRFWTSDLPPDSALHLAYSVSAGSLARQAFARRWVPEASAQVGAPRLLIAAGWVLGLAGLAMLLSWRREMDV
jgi:hypothetical protein